MNFTNMSYNEIKEYIYRYDLKNQVKYTELLNTDKRKTVRKLGDIIQKNYNELIKEEARLYEIMDYERTAIKSGFRLVAGIDEAGRGPLAGPVVAAAVILPINTPIYYLNDSKQLSLRKREELFSVIKDIALDIGIGIVDNLIIDEINILNATKLAMKKAINSLVNKPDFLLIDAISLTDIDIEQQGIIKGDSKSISIAAASIIAKVTRDRILNNFHSEYPNYGFDKHKGYGTKEHYESIEKYGITDIHRKTFLKSILDY